MTSIRAFWQRIVGQLEVESAPAERADLETIQMPESLDLEIAPNDHLLAYLQNVSGVVDVDSLNLDSPAVEALREAGVKMIVPLVSQGGLVGLINLGPRLSEQEYSADDRKLLGDLATQAAPAVRVAQLARQQQAEARERERLEQELRVARLIQQTLLPKELPSIAGYGVSTHYQPAREVGGDFYDFLEFDDGRFGIIVGDVTDKGVPAALVMATTRTLLRAAAERLVSPGEVLKRVNELLHPDIPARMFVTCLYAILDPESGRLHYANAGHDLPYRRGADGVDELRATGMPLGLMPGMQYEEKDIFLRSGDTVLFHSDGLVEAHAPDGEMFGFPRLQELMAEHPGGAPLIPYLLDQLHAFTKEGWEQEDDVTLVALQREPDVSSESLKNAQEQNMIDEWVSVNKFAIASQQGNERKAMEQVAALVEPLNMPADRLEKLKTAVSEATMNAMEHGNRYEAEALVQLEVLKSEKAVAIRITDQGIGKPIVQKETPDIEAKLAGLQSPRGWGLFLIKNMVDEMNIIEGETQHTLELIVNLAKPEE